MAVKLFSLGEFPDRIAVSKLEQYIEGGVFFLDFSRRLQIIRELFGRALPFGVAIGLFVPVVHQGESHGGYVISVHNSDPAFKVVRQLWKQHYPRPQTTRSGIADGLKIISDFATQFPDDSK
jgi:hypothetical protein